MIPRLRSSVRSTRVTVIIDCGPASRAKNSAAASRNASLSRSIMLFLLHHYSLDAVARGRQGLGLYHRAKLRTCLDLLYLAFLRLQRHYFAAAYLLVAAHNAHLRTVFKYPFLD